MVRLKFWHILKPNKTSQFPRQFIFFDTETNQEQLNDKETAHTLKLGVACYWRIKDDGYKDVVKYCRFTQASEFWDFVDGYSRDKSRIFLIAHNIAFDFKVLGGFERMKQDGYKLKKLIVNGTTNIWEFSRDSQKIVCLDNMNYFKMSLKMLGQSVGIAKGEMPDGDQSLETWFEYCQRDVDVMFKTWQAWLDFLRANDLGTFAKTLASQAFNAFKHRFMKHQIWIHNHEQVTALERDSYHGGRTEAFFIGKVPASRIYYLDVSSMYPSVMLKNKYPTKMIGYYKSCDINWLIKQLDTCAATAKVIVNTPENVFAVRHNNRLVFPVGRFETTLTTRELLYAHQKNYIEAVGETALYLQETIFADYVDFFYQSRRRYSNEGNNAFAFACKLLLNSLYGKFGQRNLTFDKAYTDENSPDGYWQEWDVERQKNISYRSISGNVEKSAGLVEGFDSFAAIPAHITADARLLLYRYMKTAQPQNVYYCDTDSLFVNPAGFARLHLHIKDKELGKLGIVKIGHDMQIHGLKDYVFDGEVTLKGIRKDAKKLSANSFEQIQFEGLKGALHKGRINTMVTTQIVKTLNRVYNKGVVKPNGVVEPFTLNIETVK